MTAARMTTGWIVLGAGAALAAMMPAMAAAQAREWTTSGYDAQRSGWVRSDPRISGRAIEEGQFQFLWKHTFENETRQLNGLTEPVYWTSWSAIAGSSRSRFSAAAATASSRLTPTWPGPTGRRT